MTNHTPGPWFIDDYGDIVRNIPDLDPMSYPIVLMSTRKGVDIDNDADRDLILAAPDMYEALLKIHGMLEAAGQDAHIMHAWAVRALKKARGEL